MSNLLRCASLLAAILFTAFSIHAQSTYESVYSIFQAKCISCHSGVTPTGNMDLGAAPGTVYTTLVNAIPDNATAQANNLKRISPGNVERSFLLKKINNNLYHNSTAGLETGMGGPMPQYPGTGLTDKEIELIRQWVLFGAPQTGYVADTALINGFYDGLGFDGIPNPLTPPAPADGFQVYVGKFFVPPGTEKEYFLKYDPALTTGIEIPKIVLSTVPQSHHFVIYKYNFGAADAFPDGLRDTSLSSHGSADILSGFSPSVNVHQLPEGTAYQLQATDVLDLNYHLVNNDPDSILGVELYLNFYTQPTGTADHLMFSRFFPNLQLNLPMGDTTVIPMAAVDSSETNMWKIWIMYTHTHRYGLDYDVWFREADGSKGEQVYEGFYNFDYTFNQGYYAYGVEAPQRHFDPQLNIDPREGFIHQATYYNYAGPNPVGFGLTSQDEMMVFGFQYYYGDELTGIDPKEKANSFKIYPNPGNGDFVISLDKDFTQGQMVLQVMNMEGQIVLDKTYNNLAPDTKIPLNMHGLPKGIYMVKSWNNTEVFTQKIIIQ